MRSDLDQLSASDIRELGKKYNADPKWIEEFIQTYDKLLLACEELEEGSKDDPLLRWKFPITRRGKQ